MEREPGHCFWMVSAFGLREKGERDGENWEGRRDSKSIDNNDMMLKHY